MKKTQWGAMALALGLSVGGCTAAAGGDTGDKSLLPSDAVFELRTGVSIPDQPFECVGACRPVLHLELLEPTTSDATIIATLTSDGGAPVAHRVPLDPSQTTLRIGYVLPDDSRGSWTLSLEASTDLSLEVSVNARMHPRNEYVPSCEGVCGDLCGEDLCPGGDGFFCGQIPWVGSRCMPAACESEPLSWHECAEPQFVFPETPGGSVTVRGAFASFEDYTHCYGFHVTDEFLSRDEIAVTVRSFEESESLGFGVHGTWEGCEANRHFLFGHSASGERHVVEIPSTGTAFVCVALEGASGNVEAPSCVTGRDVQYEITIEGID